MGESTATVVGGGIAGLAAATVLARAGWATVVLEGRPDLSEAGAGVALPRNGVTALRALGFDDELIGRTGYRTVLTGFRDRSGRPILAVPNSPDIRPTITVLGVHRQRLHSTLLRMARHAGAEVLGGARVTAVRPGVPGGRRATVAWRAEGTERTAESDLVVGADGMWSTVRSELFPQARARYSGSTSWRAIIPKNGFDDRLLEYWGPGAEFGAIPVSDTELYWYGYFRHPEGAVFDDEPAAARARFSGWAPEIAEQIAATAPENLMRHDVHHLPGGLPSYARGRAVMVGDAAHAALPTMGQGVSTALEDAVCVGALIGAPVARGRDLGPALAAFDADRRPRCRAITRQSALIARIGADLGGGLPQKVRNAGFRLIPGRTLARAGAPLVQWTPPA
ncbi:FAD-dependent monooxygenase [Nocardiopsis chromatogenes]|uniref:FAD-dependent monooxygenase n=1 Tax=Nocardiopsis chromatogenes TaxID=280239 RepID=UPI00034B3B79|nr:FAD-dependent monooxygenase [Nocardiopsis chromatogenes]